jgi:hypothetical protein
MHHVHYSQLIPIGSSALQQAESANEKNMCVKDPATPSTTPVKEPRLRYLVFHTTTGDRMMKCSTPECPAAGLIQTPEDIG